MTRSIGSSGRVPVAAGATTVSFNPLCHSLALRPRNPIPAPGPRCDGGAGRVTLGSREYRLEQRAAIPTRSTSRIL